MSLKSDALTHTGVCGGDREVASEEPDHVG
jgi:hypothetical protein